jgi:hypothetical protein
VKKSVIMVALAFLLLTSCKSTPNLTTSNATTAATWSADFCTPLGDPMQSNLAGSNAFALCKNGGVKGNSVILGEVTQYYIRCNTNTLRAGWKWVIYCGPGGKRCDCNLNSMWANPLPSTNAAWTAGEHCTNNGQASPGANGCDAW